ncbi:unnamed protein product, partial [Mesorhabditis spiculigera]
MKETGITAPKAVTSITQIKEFLEHFRPTKLIYDYLFPDCIDRVAQCERLLQGELFRKLERLHICGFMGNQYRWLLHFLLRRISDWLRGEGEIDKLQICVVVEKVAVTLTPEMGWIDRTYEGMELILRASDGQALLVFWDDVDGYFYLIRCEYNYRRGRCLGSYQRNEDSLRRIRQLMRLSMELHERNPELAENAREKLKNECIKFNAYNKGATQIDLMTDSIWRPKGERRSLWGIVDGNVRHDSVYLMDSPVLHAFRFAKAFEEREHFKPAELICKNFLRRFVVENHSAARKLVEEELVYPMETLHISFIASALKFLELLRAKDLRITCEPPTRNASTNILNFLAGKIQNWLCGTIEIDKLQLITAGEKLGTAAIEKFIDHLARTVEPELGWVDRTYKGMELILRASDGQALIYYWDARKKCLGLFRCEYNFRRGRCLGSYQRNGDSLSRISKLMGISLRLSAQNPELAENAKDKLKDECIKFNAYNKGATTLDLLTDVIWRPKGNPRSLWGTRGNTMAQPEIYPVDLALDHAYKFTKAFEARGALPELDPPMVLIKSREDEDTRTVFTHYLRLFLANSTVQDFLFPPWFFGGEFWLSLDMKGTQLCCNTAEATFPQIRQFIEHFRSSALLVNQLFHDDNSYPLSSLNVSVLAHPMIRSMEKLHIFQFFGQVKWLDSVCAKDLYLGLVEVGHSTKMGQQSIFEFLSRKIQRWLRGQDEIDKIQLCTDVHMFATNAIQFEPFLKALPFFISSEVGWVDETYDEMPLILRASDGEALLLYFDGVDRSIYLIRCDYNFRRGRCLGIFERNEKGLQKIRGLMTIASRLSAQNPGLAEDAKEKLKNECIKFNEYNKRATQLDLMTDWIWRPQGQKVSIWRRRDGQLWEQQRFPFDLALRHAYKFSKAVEMRGELPGVEEFMPATKAETNSS